MPYNKERNSLDNTYMVKEVLGDKLYQTIKKGFPDSFSLDDPNNQNIWVCKVFHSEQALYYKDLKKSFSSLDNSSQIAITSLGYTGCYCFPLKHKGEKVGVIFFYNMRGKFRLGNKIKKILHQCADLISYLIVENSKYQLLYRQKDELRKINAFTQEINQSLEYEVIVKNIFNYLAAIFGFDGFIVSLISKGEKTFFLDMVQVPEKFTAGAQLMSGEIYPMEKKKCGVIGKCMMTNSVHYAPSVDIKTLDEPINRRATMLLNIVSTVTLPIEIRGKVIGAFTLMSHDKKIFLSGEQLDSLKNFTNQIGSTIKNSRLYKEINDKNRIFDEELALAVQVQKSILPQKSPETEHYKIAFKNKPMLGVGGDFFHFFTLDHNLLGIFISDVSGHGISAALITTMLKTLLKSNWENFRTPHLFLKSLNQNLLSQTSGQFLTALYAVYDIQKRKFTYAKAAHPPALLIRKNTVTELDGKGKMLAIFDDLNFEEKSLTLQKGDKILLYTDGLLEASDNEGAEFESLLTSVLVNNSALPVDLYVEKIYSALVAHHESEDFEDDVCLIGLEIR